MSDFEVFRLCGVWVGFSLRFGIDPSGISCSLVEKCIGNPTSIVFLDNVDVKESLSYNEVLFEILDHQVLKLRNKEVAFVNFFWRNQLVKSVHGRPKPYDVQVPTFLFPLLQFQPEVLACIMYSFNMCFTYSHVSIYMHIS